MTTEIRVGEIKVLSTAYTKPEKDKGFLLPTFKYVYQLSLYKEFSASVENQKAN